jgi:hypothetical protein
MDVETGQVFSPIPGSFLQEELRQILEMEGLATVEKNIIIYCNCLEDRNDHKYGFDLGVLTNPRISPARGAERDG